MTLTEAPPNVPPTRSRWLLTIVMVGQFMALLDASIVNVAMPTIHADLHASGAALQMIVAGYVIAYAMLLITGARLGDLAGHRRMFLAGVAAFTAASLACGLAPSVGLLIAFRFAQGAAAAMLIPQVLSLIQLHFTGPARARALSLYSGTIAGGAVAGQVLGGLLVGADLFGTGWRPVFMVNVPVGLALLLAGTQALPADRPRQRSGTAFDIPGLTTLSLSVLALVVPLVLGREEGWPWWGWASMAASLVIFAGFVLAERRAQRPLVSNRVLRAPGIIPAMVAIFVNLATFGGLMFAVTLHLQSYLGESPLRAGLTFAPCCAMFGLTSLTWRRFPQRWHRIMIPAGYLLAALSYLGLTVCSGAVSLALMLSAAGIGLGVAFSPLLTGALSRVAVADAADASGLLVTVNQLGLVVGVAAFGTLYLGRPPAHALGTTGLALAATVTVAAICGLLLPRQKQN